MSIWIPVALLFIGFFALFIELFIPALGIIGGIGIILAIASTVVAYRNFGSQVGIYFLAGTLIGVPLLVVIGLRLFPKTPLGRWLILRKSEKSNEGFTAHNNERYTGLLGKEGVTLTLLRPSGMVKIDGEKYSVIAEGELIEAGRKVRVIRVEGNRIVVRKV